MTAYQRTLAELRAEPRSWLITGMAGFIGSHLLETLLKLGQRVVGVDNFSTGTPLNLEDVRTEVGEAVWKNFEYRDGTVADIGVCREVSNRVDFVLHQAAFTSVPLSIEDPIACHDTNVTGTLNLLVAARDNRVRRFVYASSKTVYGNDTNDQSREDCIGEPLTPYAASKRMAEHYARQFGQHYSLETIGLRYFNVFGPRQNPIGGYAAVIPQWINALIRGKKCRIYGDGTNTRDFCPVENIVQANILAATARERVAVDQVYNVALGGSTSLNEIYARISKLLAEFGIEERPVEYAPARIGDVPYSSADITKIRRELGYEPLMDLERGLERTVEWFVESIKAAKAGAAV